jgi:glycosyltransferase involved in cell wall biosynthesis
MKSRRFSAKLVYGAGMSGISRDIMVIESSLSKGNFSCQRLPMGSDPKRPIRALKFITRILRLFVPVDIQFHLELIQREQFYFGRVNFMLLNPEFTDPNIFGKLSRNPVLLCKTMHASTLFSGYEPSLEYTGFTSPDRLRPWVEKSYRKFIHIAGKSDYKGTRTLVKVWSENPSWPELTVVWSPIDSYGKPRQRLEVAPNVRVINERLTDEAIFRLINEHGVHLCPSETEGFGHYILEALSAASVVVTLDAPPMNELVSNDHGYLVEALPAGKQFMSTLYKPDIDSLKRILSTVMKTSVEDLAYKGQRAREWYLNNNRQFQTRLNSILQKYLPG